MKTLFENLERLGARARAESPAADSGLAEKVFLQITDADTADPRWPIVAVTAGYATAACAGMAWVFSAYAMITHPLLQFFNSVAPAAF